MESAEEPVSSCRLFVPKGRHEIAWGELANPRNRATKNGSPGGATRSRSGTELQNYVAPAGLWDGSEAWPGVRRLTPGYPMPSSGLEKSSPMGTAGRSASPEQAGCLRSQSPPGGGGTAAGIGPPEEQASGVYWNGIGA